MIVVPTKLYSRMTKEKASSLSTKATATKAAVTKVSRVRPIKRSAQQKLVWITGGSSGIGAQLAKDYADRGWLVAITARNEAALKLVISETKHKKAIFAFPCDVTKQKLMQQLFEAIEAKLGPVDKAIANAGIYLPTELPEFDAQIFVKSFDVNLNGTVNTLAPVIPAMLKRGGGQLAIMASVAGFGGLPSSAAYGATKAALLNMGEALAMEYRQHNINISVIAPGFVRTPATAPNEFAMPFLVEVEDASARIINGLERGKFLISFPRRFSILLRLLNLLPRWLYVSLFARGVPRRS